GQLIFHQEVIGLTGEPDVLRQLGDCCRHGQALLLEPIHGNVTQPDRHVEMPGPRQPGRPESGTYGPFVRPFTCVTSAEGASVTPGVAGGAYGACGDELRAVAVLAGADDPADSGAARLTARPRAAAQEAARRPGARRSVHTLPSADVEPL